MSRAKKRSLPRGQRDDALILSKRDVAERLLRTAIKLFFAHEDVVSAHVLAGAAQDIIAGAAARGAVATLVDRSAQELKPEYREAFKETLREDYLFFKHGSRDPLDVNDKYHPAITEIALLMACEDLHHLWGPIFFEGAVFRAWFAVRHPDALEGSDVIEQISRTGFFPANLGTLPLQEAAQAGSRYLEAASRDGSAEFYAKLALASAVAKALDG